jgi:NAD(P)H-hydrate epimerase
VFSIPVLNAEQSARWDDLARTVAHVPTRVLMEAAGRAVAAVAAREYTSAVRQGVIVVAGHGNNGGDGWVAARALAAAGARVWAAEEVRARSADCEANRALAIADGVEMLDPSASWPPAGVVIDALLGTGATGAPRGAIAELARRVAAHPGPVVAIDGPTGLDLSSGTAHGPVRATLTVTFGGVRRGHLIARDWCGRVVVADIGLPAPDASWPVLLNDVAAGRLLPRFQVDMHKGSRGRVLVLGGDVGMAGAALHAASGAFAAGSGLVKIAAAGPSVEAAQALLPDALTVRTSLGSKLEAEVVESLEWADTLVLGPGLGRTAARRAFVNRVLERAKVPVVLDADALQIGLDVLRMGKVPRVLTPHQGEFRVTFPDLTGLLAKDRFAAAEAAAATARFDGEAGAVAVLLKGVPTIVASAGRPTAVVATGNPALATGGSGDLLSGFIGAYLARGLEPRDAAALGAFTLGRGAEIAARRHTVRATRPADVLAALPELWRQLAEPPAIRPPVLLELEPPALV